MLTSPHTHSVLVYLSSITQLFDWRLQVESDVVRLSVTNYHYILYETVELRHVKVSSFTPLGALTHGGGAPPLVSCLSSLSPVLTSPSHFRPQ